MSEPSEGCRPVDQATLDGRGGRARLEERWSMVRQLVAHHAQQRTIESKEMLEEFLRKTAIELALDTKHILPRKQYPELWRTMVPGYWMNPICNVTLTPSREGMRPHTLHRLQVLDDELVRFLRITDAVLASLGASGGPQDEAAASANSKGGAAPTPRGSQKKLSAIRWSIDVKKRVTVGDAEVEAVLPPALGELFLEVARASPRQAVYATLLQDQLARGLVRTSTATIKKKAYRVKKALGDWLGQHWCCDGSSAWWQPPEGSGPR